MNTTTIKLVADNPIRRARSVLAHCLDRMRNAFTADAPREQDEHAATPGAEATGPVPGMRFRAPISGQTAEVHLPHVRLGGWEKKDERLTDSGRVELFSSSGTVAATLAAMSRLDMESGIEEITAAPAPAQAFPDEPQADWLIHSDMSVTLCRGDDMFRLNPNQARRVAYAYRELMPAPTHATKPAAPELAVVVCSTGAIAVHDEDTMIELEPGVARRLVELMIAREDC